MAYPNNLATDIYQVTPNDSADLPTKAYAFKANTAGTVRFLTDQGSDVTITYAAGDIEPTIVKKIFATGTTATVFAYLR